MRVDGRIFSRALANVLLFCPRTRPWVRFRYEANRICMMACDDYAVGTDSADAELAGDGWPDTDLYLSKEYAEELEKASRQAGGRGKDRGFYEFTAEAFTEASPEQAWFSWKVDSTLRHRDPSPYQPVAFLPTNLAKFCRVRRHDDKVAILDVNIGDPVQVKVGTFTGVIKQIDRGVYAKRQDPEGLW